MSTLCMSLPSKIEINYCLISVSKGAQKIKKDHNEEFVLKPDFSPAMKWNHPLLNSHRDDI